MELNLIKDFHFVYTLIGPPYINSLVKMLQTAPKEANVVIITNTPEILNDVYVPCNLTVVDLETLRTDEDRINEPILRLTDEDEYFREINKTWYSFPINIIRHGIKWCVDNNITKLALCDVGCYIGFENSMYDAFKKFEQHLQVPECNNNIILCYPNTLIKGPQFDDFENRMNEEYNQIPGLESLMTSFGFIPNNNISSGFDFLFLLHDNTFVMERYNGTLDLDGFIIGYIFDDKNLLLKYYDFLDKLTKLHYKNKSHMLVNNVVKHEFSTSFTSEMFCRFHNITLTSYNDVVMHDRRPDNDPSVVHFKHQRSWFIQTQTRKEFIEANRECLIYHYGGKIKLYGMEKDFNWTEEEFFFITEMYNNLLKLWKDPMSLEHKETVELNREFFIYYYGPEKIKKYNLEDMLLFNENEWLDIKNKFDNVLSPYVYLRDYERN